MVLTGPFPYQYLMYSLDQLDAELSDNQYYNVSSANDYPIDELGKSKRATILNNKQKKLADSFNIMKKVEALVLQNNYFGVYMMNAIAGKNYFRKHII
jgi:hypothetical protein